MPNYKHMLGIEPAPTTELTVTSRPTMQVVFPVAAHSQRDGALGLAAMVLKVDNAQDQVPAVEAQRQLKEVIRLVEDGIGKEVDLANTFKKKLWSARDEFLKDTRDQLARITRMVGDFQTLAQAKARAAEAARNAELAELEQQRAEAMAQANSHEELDAIAEDFNRQAAAVPITEPPRVEGQRIVKDYEVTVSDVWALARAHPACVRIEALTGQVKTLIKAGLTKIPGVAWKEVTKADVRLNTNKFIEI